MFRPPLAALGLTSAVDVLLLAAGLGGAVLCGWGGWRRGRRVQPAGKVVAGLAVLWGLMLSVAGAFALLTPTEARPIGPVGAQRIVALVSVAVVSAAAIPAGFAIGMACASVARPRGD